MWIHGGTFNFWRRCRNNFFCWFWVLLTSAKGIRNLSSTRECYVSVWVNIYWTLDDYSCRQQSPPSSFQDDGRKKNNTSRPCKNCSSAEYQAKWPACIQDFSATSIFIAFHAIFIYVNKKCTVSSTSVHLFKNQLSLIVNRPEPYLKW